MKKIKDPLREEYISVGDDLMDIIDTPEVQRLRRIRQLGFSSLVYPGATHTRFSHTLGVLWTTKQFLDSVTISDEDLERQLKSAALLHDTGHGPYSHVIETVSGTKDHEEKSCEIVVDLAKRGLIPDEDVTPIQDFIHGERNPDILSGDIDADRIDYLSRDDHYTGIDHGTIDSQTIIENAKLVDGQLVFDEQAIQAIEGLLVSRKNMHGSVYSHPTVRSAEKMLSECIQRSSSITPESVYEYSDYTLHSELMQSNDPIVSELFSRLNNRNLYKTAFCLRKMHQTEIDMIDKTQFEQDLQDDLDLDEHEVFIDWYPQNPDDLSITVDVDGVLRDFNEVSGFQKLRKANGYAVQMSVYCPEEYEDVVSSYCRSAFNIDNS